jgi:hypothetical protein
VAGEHRRRRAGLRDCDARPQPAGRHRPGIGLYIGETFAGIFLPDIVKYLPFNVATASVATGKTTGGGEQIAAVDANTAIVLVVVWLIGSLAVAALFTERAEISG